MEENVEIDQFSLLEKKVEALIEGIVSIKAEKDVLEKRNQDLSESNANLTSEIEQLKRGKDEARVKVESLLEKIGDLEF